MARVDNISAWNAKIDRTLTVRRVGRQGILYEYELPYGANPMKYYEEAINVKSIKGKNKRPSTSKKHEGTVYQTGMYQPIGDKRYFTYYQINKMLDANAWNAYIEDLIRRKDEYMLKKLKDAIIMGVLNGEL